MRGSLARPGARLAVFAALLAGACNGLPLSRHAGAPAAPGSEGLTSLVFRGTAVYGHEVREFRPCGTADALWAIDRSGRLWELYQQLAPGERPYEGIFAVLQGRREPAPGEGFAAGYRGQLRVERVLYAGSEGPGCAADWDGFYYRAYGNEPFWNAEVSRRGLALRRLGHADLEWRQLAREQTESGMRYLGRGATQVTLSITREPCRDSMSGAYFALSAVLRFGDEELLGCVLTGAEPPAQ